jgi:hypothetical protein
MIVLGRGPAAGGHTQGVTRPAMRAEARECLPSILAIAISGTPPAISSSAAAVAVVARNGSDRVVSANAGSIWRFRDAIAMSDARSLLRRAAERPVVRDPATAVDHLLAWLRCVPLEVPEPSPQRSANE